MKRLSRAACRWSSLSGVRSGAQAPPERHSEDSTSRSTRCANGLEVILSEDHRVPLVGVDRLVSRRTRERSARPHRFCPPVRTHDVPGIETHRERCAFPACSRRSARPALTARPTSIGRTTSKPFRQTSWRLALWLESDRMGYLLEKVDQAEAVESAGRRPERAAAELRKPAVRDRRRSDVSVAVSQGSSVPRQRHRFACGHSGGEARRREAVSSGSITRRTTRRSRSSATSTRRRRKSSSRNTSAR